MDSCKVSETDWDALIPNKIFSCEGALIRRADVRFAVRYLIDRGIKGGCEIEGCDYPPGMTHLHHPKRWVDGGQTNRDAIMICPPHHHRAHDERYTLTQLPTGKYGFHRRT